VIGINTMILSSWPDAALVSQSDQHCESLLNDLMTLGRVRVRLEYAPFPSARSWPTKWDCG